MKRILKTNLLIFILSIVYSHLAYSVDLKISFMDGSYPRFYIEKKDGELKMAGMCIEMMEEVEKRVPEINFVYDVKLTPFARIKHELKLDNIQAAFGFARNAEREKIYQYTDTPLYPVKFLIFALKSDEKAQKIQTFEDMEAHGGTMLGMRGTNAIKVFEDKTKELNIPIEVVTTMEQNIKKIIAGRGSFFTYNHIDAIGAIKKLGYFDKFMTLPIVTKDTYHWLAFSKGVSPEIVEKVNKALRDMEESGELREIYEKYVN